MPPVNRHLGVGIKVDVAEIRRELEKMRQEVNRALGGPGDGASKRAVRELSNTVRDLTQQMSHLVDVQNKLAQSHAQVQKATQRTLLETLNLRGGIKGYIQDVEKMILIQARWYGARALLFAPLAAYKSGVLHAADVDQAQAMLLRYEAMEGEVTAAHRRNVEEMVRYARHLSVTLPVEFEQVVKAADRLRAAGVDFDTVRASLESFAKLQIAFPEINPEKFTTAIIGFLNTYRNTPGLKELANDTERLQVILDKVTVALAKGVIAPQDIGVLIQHLGQMSQAAGFSIDQMLALSVMVTNLGSKAGPAGRALRGLIDSLTSPKGIENLEKIGVYLDRAKTPAEQLKTIIEGLRRAVGTGEQGMSLGAMEFLRGIAPTERRSVLIALIKELEKYEGLVGSISKSQGALDRTSGEMANTMQSQWTILKNLSVELGKALVNSDLLKSGMSLLTDALRVLGFMLSGLVGVSSLIVDGFKAIYHIITVITNPIERLIMALAKAITGDFKGALNEIMGMPQVAEDRFGKFADSLTGALDRAAKQTLDIQEVLFGGPKGSGGGSGVTTPSISGDTTTPDLPGKDVDIKKTDVYKAARARQEMFEREMDRAKRLYEARINYERNIAELTATDYEKRMLQEDEYKRRLIENLDVIYSNRDMDLEENRKAYEAQLDRIDRAIASRKQKIRDEFYKENMEGLIPSYFKDTEVFDVYGETKGEHLQRLINQQKAWIPLLVEAKQQLEGQGFTGVQAYQDINRALQEYKNNQKELNEYTGTFMEGLEEGIKRYVKTIESGYQSGLQVVQNVTHAMESSWASFFDYTSDRFLKFGDLARDILHSIYLEMVKAQIVKPMVSATMTFAQGFFGGGRASGGDVYSGTAYLVGERGPELFVPNRSGTVIPNHQLNNQNVTFNPTIKVEVVNQSSQPVNVKTGSVKFNGKDYVVGIILEDFAHNGPISQNMSLRK